jgi:hypothetical protein
MIAQLIQVLNVAAETLPVDKRYGWAQIVQGVPSVHIEGTQWKSVVQDTNGTWSYVRINGQTRVEPVDIGEPCGGVRVRLPLRLVALIDRSDCGELPGLLVQTAGSIRQARKQFLAASGAYRINFASILWQIDDFATQEFQPLPQIPTNRVLVAIDVIMEVDGREDCFEGCGELTDVVCAIIAKASNAKVIECLGPTRVAQICDIPPTTVNGTESDIPTITVLQGGVQVGTLNPATGVHTVPPCPEPCTDPLSVDVDWGEGRRVQIALIEDRCESEDVLLDCDSLTNALRVEGCGCPVANAVYAPDGTNRYSNYGETRIIVATGALPAQWEIRTDANVVFYRSVGTWNSPLDVEEWTVVDGPMPAPTAVVEATLSEVVQTSCGSCPVPWKLLNLDGDILQEGEVANPCALPEEGLLIAAPNATVFRDGEPFASVLSGGFVNVPSASCANAAVTWDGSPLLSIPSGGTEDIDCNTLVNAAYAQDGGSVTGTYKPDGTLNSREVFRLDVSHNFEYTGTRWRLVKPGSDYDAAPGLEVKPWEADWSATPVTVTQATIGAYCDDCEPCGDAEIQINGSAWGTVASGGLENIPVINPRSVPVGSKVGSDWVVPDATDNIVQITASGTYTPPAGLREVVVFAQAPGGGGGGGRSNGTGGSATGGGAGGSGAYVIRRIPASSLGAPVTVTIGAAGSGGAGAAPASNGGNGTDGGDVSFGAFVIAKGGVGGLGGSASGASPTNIALASACTPPFRPWASTGVGGVGSATTTTVNGVNGAEGAAGMAPRGGSGGGRVTTGTAFAGGDGGGIYENSVLVSGAAGASVAGAAGSNGTDNVKLDYLALHTTLTPTIGHGTAGGGGAYNVSGAGGAGGTGGKGTGGAGGGGANASFNGGAGGNGGAGFIVILERF